MNPANQLRLTFMFNCFGKLFIAGTKAKGILKVSTLRETTIKRIKIGLIGKIIMEVDENDNPTTIEKVFYCSEEHIFDSSDLFNGEDDEQLLEFAVPLANNLPSSVMLKQGGVIYYLYASMEEMFLDETTQNINTEANVSVVNLIDCNKIPKAAKDKSANKAPVQALYMCKCLQNQEDGDTLHISPRAYVPGDCIKINAAVYNSRSYPLCYVQAALVQKVKLKYEDHSLKTERVVSETKHGCVMPESLQVWHDELLRIPPLPPTTYHKYLTITYKLQLCVPGKLNVNNALENASALLSVPVMIGNVPLEATLVYFNRLPRCESFESKMLPLQTPYDEYARSDRCIQSEEGVKFVPSYITYLSERAMDNVDLEGSTPV